VRGVDLDGLAKGFRAFGRDAAGGDSPLYAQLSELVADSPALLALAARSRERSPTLLFAAIHDELLREPDHELARFYPTVGGDGPGPGLGAALEAFCAERATQLEATLTTRSTQTNETGRCSALLPAFASLADGRPLALIEMGASAGLNLNFDRYAYDYGSRRAGVAGSPLTLPCELVGPHVPPLDPPAVASRVGVDLSPPDLTDSRDARWLRACVWADQTPRLERLEAALAIAAEHPVEVHRGDGFDLLPGLIDAAPRDALVCVFHTAVLIYFSHEQRQALEALLAGAGRDVAWVAGEIPGLVVPGRVEPGTPFWFSLAAGRPGAMVQRGRMGHHGAWLEWGG
jgi:hypothetical protein